LFHIKFREVIEDPCPGRSRAFLVRWFRAEGHAVVCAPLGVLGGIIIIVTVRG
jgi:hypothetical protein